MTDGQYTVYFIPHTHWDREWYEPFQHYRLRLVRLVDRLLDLLDRDPEYVHFGLDGQAVVLSDYLEIRPEKRAALQERIGEGRIGVGPWYVLPDEFLVSGESLVRNLMLGHRIAAEFGHVQKVGYVPDTFGHISQLPQILRGFDIGTAMHFRGLDETGLRSELWWESPDGSRVLLRHLPTYAGYTGAAVLSRDLEQAIGDLESLAREEVRRAATPVLLAMNGLDHMEARQDVPELVRRASERYEHLTFVHASLEQYFAALEAAIDGVPLQVVRGELRDTNRTPNRVVMRVLPNVLSSRIYNKQQNERAQTELERWAEPWSALMWLEGDPYPAAFLWKAWEWLLKNHPHDSIGGCSVDSVHSQMETRFAWATEIAEMVTAGKLRWLAEQIDGSELGENEAALVLFNSLAWEWDGVVTVDIDLPLALLNRWALDTVVQPPAEITPDMDFPDIYRWRPAVEWGGAAPMPNRDFRGLSLRSLADGTEIPLQMESRSQAMTVNPLADGLNFCEVVRVRASFPAHIPAYGYATFGVRPETTPNRHTLTVRPHNVLENEFLRVEIAGNGSLTVTDKRSGERYVGLGYFEDGGDCGDGYTYSNPAEDRVLNSLGLAPQISCLAAGPAVQRYRLDYQWALPIGLDELRRRRRGTSTECPLSVVVSLAAGSRQVDLEVTFDNRVKDHRLRMLFPADLSTDVSYSDAQYDVVAHPVRPEPPGREAWIEDAPVAFPMQSWVDLSDGQRGLAVITRGLPEYEVLDTERREIAITLLRAVGYLAAGPELQTAINGAGPHIQTPEAQIQRKLTFHLSLLPHSGVWEQAEVWREAQRANVPPRPVTLDGALGGVRPAAGSFLAVSGRNIILSAVKQAEQGETLVVRVCNPSSEPARGTLTLAAPAATVHRASLDETVMDGTELLAADAEGAWPLELGPKQILTLKIELE